MTTNEQTKLKTSFLKISVAAIATAVLVGCNPFRITENQREVIGNQYWKDYYGESGTGNPVQQNAVVSRQQLPNAAGTSSETGSYDLSQEANAAHSGGFESQSAAQANSELTVASDSGASFENSVQNAISTNQSVPIASTSQVAPVPADSTASAAVPTNVKPKKKPDLLAVQASLPKTNQSESDSLQPAEAKVANNEGGKVNGVVQDNVETLPEKQQVALLNSKSEEPKRKFRWPVSGKVIAKFGPQADGEKNDGINLAVPAGTPVRSAEDGTVIYAGNELKGYGNLLLIRHEGGWVSAYAHNKDLKVDRGDEVRRGDVIAHAGSTGSVNQPQLHFELRKGNKPVDPIAYLPSN